jgi:hypothetical protein
MSDLIQATSRQVKTMADGTLRLTVDISPMDAQKAFALFGMPDAPVVLARLTQQAAMQQAQDEVIEQDAKGGFLSQWLAMRCNEPEFWRFIENKLAINNGFITNLEQCDVEVKEYLLIESKKELDNNKEAEARFHSLIRRPYADWIAGKRTS